MRNQEEVSETYQEEVSETYQEEVAKKYSALQAPIQPRLLFSQSS